MDCDYCIDIVSNSNIRDVGTDANLLVSNWIRNMNERDMNVKARFNR